MDDSTAYEAMSLLSSHEWEAALRYTAPELDRDPMSATALMLTASALAESGRRKAGAYGMRVAVDRALATRDLPVAIAAFQYLRALENDVTSTLDEIVACVLRGPSGGGDLRDPIVSQEDSWSPVGTSLAGKRLVAFGLQLLHRAGAAASTGGSSWRLFDGLSATSARDLILAFDVVTVPPGRAVVEQGAEVTTSYVVVRGVLELSRRVGPPAVHRDEVDIIASCAPGMVFGELALVGRTEAAATVTTRSPCILLALKRADASRLSADYRAVEQAFSHAFREASLLNLGRACPMVMGLSRNERDAITSRLEVHTVRAGETLLAADMAPTGLHFVASGEVSLVGREAGERVVMSSRGPGDTVGDAELVLDRTAEADAMATKEATTLFLPRAAFLDLIAAFPHVLYRFYQAALLHHEHERRDLLSSATLVVGEECLVEDSKLAAPEARAMPEHPMAEQQPAAVPHLPRDRDGEAAVRGRPPVAPPPRTSATPPPLTSSVTIPPPSASSTPHQQSPSLKGRRRWMVKTGALVVGAAAVVVVGALSRDDSNTPIGRSAGEHSRQAAALDLAPEEIAPSAPRDTVSAPVPPPLVPSSSVADATARLAPRSLSGGGAAPTDPKERALHQQHDAVTGTRRIEPAALEKPAPPPRTSAALRDEQTVPHPPRVATAPKPQVGAPQAAPAVTDEFGGRE